MFDVAATAALIFFPFLSRLPGDWFNGKAVLSNVRVIEDTFIRPQIESHLKTFSKDTVTDYIHAYIRQMTKRREDGKDTSLDGGCYMLAKHQSETKAIATALKTPRW